MENPATGEIIRIEGEAFAVWSGHSSPEVEVWFDYRRGEIQAENPDRETIGKMYEIAVALGAEVLGDEGEAYGPDGLPFKAPPGRP